MKALGQGIYQFSEVARFTGTTTERVRTWFLGREGRPGPLIGPGPQAEHSNTVSFHGLIDALVVSKLRDDYDISMQYLRRVHSKLMEEFQVQYPFSRKDFLTDGKRIFVAYADGMGEEHLKELLTQQKAFPSILKNYLRYIEYDAESMLARRWHIEKGIVIDPERRYGKPIVEAAGVPTGILAASYRANGQDLRLVANWFGVTAEAVRAAVEFEQRWGILAA